MNWWKKKKETKQKNTAIAYFWHKSFDWCWGIQVDSYTSRLYIAQIPLVIESPSHKRHLDDADDIRWDEHLKKEQ